MCLISAYLMRPCTPVKGGGGGVFPAGIDRCLFVFAMGPDSINPARVTIIPPPCQRAECVREKEGTGVGGRGGEVGGRGGRAGVGWGW